jgi:hypothetical protein
MNISFLLPVNCVNCVHIFCEQVPETHFLTKTLTSDVCYYCEKSHILFWFKCDVT